MTGLEIIAVQGDKKCIFKVRHDGYLIEDYIKEFEFPQGNTIEEAVLHFKNWFESGPWGYDELETNFPNGFSFTTKTKEFEEILLESHSLMNDFAKKNPIGEDEEEWDGLCCSYGDYQVFFNIDTKKFEYANR